MQNFRSIILGLILPLCMLGWSVDVGAQVTSQPKDVYTILGATAEFSVAAAGTGTLRYNWQTSVHGSTYATVTGTQFGGKTSSVLQISPVDGFNQTQYRCVVSDDNGTFASNAATLYIYTPPTYTVSYTKNGAPTNYVKQNDVVTVTVAFNEMESSNPSPQISLSAISGNAVSVAATNLTMVDNQTFTYQWTVGTGDGVLKPQVTRATDITGNLVTDMGSTQTTVTVDNTAPNAILSNPNNASTTNPISIVLSEPSMLAVAANQLSNFIVFTDNGGTPIPFSVTTKQLTSSAPKIQILPTSALQCGTTYKLSINTGAITDLAGNVLAAANFLFTTQAPAKPIIAGKSTANITTKLCPGDAIVCSNFDNTLNYQWSYNGETISKATAKQFNVAAGGMGSYMITVTDPMTSCVVASDILSVSLYTVTKPMVYQKNQASTICILVVDNSQNLFSNFIWTYSDGSNLPLGLNAFRQFLVLAPLYMNANFMVYANTPDGCTVGSDPQSVTQKSMTSVVYPTINQGQFSIDAVGEQTGTMSVKIYSQMGLEVFADSFNKDNEGISHSVSTANLRPGSYVVEVSLNDFRQIHRIIVE